jgi:hypothetical protein
VASSAPLSGPKQKSLARADCQIPQPKLDRQHGHDVGGSKGRRPVKKMSVRWLGRGSSFAFEALNII